MQLTILGGAAAALNEGQGSSGYLVSHLETSVMLDPGPNTLLELRKHTDYRALTGVVISHLHLDHLLDIFALRYALAYNPIRPQGKVRLVLPPGGESFLRAMAAPSAKMEGFDDFFTDFDVSEFDPDADLAIGDLDFRFAFSVHSLPAWAMRITGCGAESRPLIYTADGGPSSDLSALGTGVHVLLTEATYGIPETERNDNDGKKVEYHRNLDEAIALAKHVEAATLVITHTFQELEPETYVTYARDRFDGDVVLAKPGVQIDWNPA